MTFLKGFLCFMTLVCSLHASNGSLDCFERWTKVFANDVNGGVVFEDRGELIQAVTSGSDVRIVMGNDATSIQNVSPLKGHLCGQALFHVSKAGYNKVQDNVYWWFVNVCTTGHFNMARYNVGEATSRGDNVDKKAVEWFVRKYPYETSYLWATVAVTVLDSQSLDVLPLGVRMPSEQSEHARPRCNKSPIYRVNNQGTVVRGSVTDVVDAVKNGHDIRITTSTSSYTFPADNLAFDESETDVAAQALWHVSRGLDVDHHVFVANAYWWFAIWSTSAARHISRWTVGAHTSRGETRDTEATEWFSDPCWRLAYRHDDQGNQIAGSLTDLVSAINQGHRVRVFYNNNIISATQINIRNGNVSASLIDSVSKASLSDFQSNVYWYWRVASTTGKISTTRYRVGINTYVTAVTVNRETMSWFVDTRPWSKVLTVGNNGAVTAGSKADLVHAVKKGAELRYRLDFPINPTGTYALLEADNIAIEDGNVGAMHVKSVSVQEVGSSEVSFQTNPYWWFTITSTTGQIDMSRWTVGIHEDRSHTNQTVTTQWFISE